MDHLPQGTDDLPEEINDYTRELIEYSIGLPVSPRTLQLKLLSCAETEKQLRHQYLYLKPKLKEKDDIIEHARAESTMNAQSVKKFVEENQKLATECSELLTQSNKWKEKCSLYLSDREALIDFRNEADNRAVEAETRVHDLEQELPKLSKELMLSKGKQVAEITKTVSSEQVLVDTLLSTIISKDDVASTAYFFLGANSGVEVCQKMLEMLESLKPSTQKVLAFASEVKKLQKEKDRLRNNLITAEEEVKDLFEEYNILDIQNRRLMKLIQKERQLKNSGGKNNKRKSSPRDCSPIEKKLDSTESGSPRQNGSTKMV